MIVEVCANSLESAINAQEAGADRIELCVELGVGGLTPSYGLLKGIKKYISIPINVLIRPRSGDFTYSDLEFDSMKADIELCKELGLNGIVTGVLFRDLTLDVERTKELVALTRPLKFTFHRAFDWVTDPVTTLEELERIGVDTLLSSGLRETSIAGMDQLWQLHQQSDHCVIMPGGGIRETNVHQFKDRGFKAVHLSGVQFHKTLKRTPTIPMSTPSFLRDDEIPISDLATLREVIRIVKE